MRSSRRLAVCPASACRPLVAVSRFHSLLIAFFLTCLRLCACEKRAKTQTKEENCESQVTADGEHRRRTAHRRFWRSGTQSRGVFTKWSLASFSKAKFSRCFGKSEWYSLCLISGRPLPCPPRADVLNASLDRSGLMHSSGPVYSGKELSDFIFPVFLSSLKNLGDFLSSSYSSLQK